jgi:uncharacterized protein YkwD
MRRCLVPGRSPLLALSFGSMVWGLFSCTPDDDEPPPPEVPDIEYCDAVREWEPAWSTFEDEVVVLLNERRAAGAMCADQLFEPAEPLRMDPALRCAARKHALDMGAQDYVSNIDPEDVDFHARAESAGYEGTALDQNIGAGHSTPEQLVTAVMGHAELCIHVMAPDADEIGVGYLEYEGASHPSYWTHVFGQSL